jgi:hypothetical protein
MTTSNPSLTCGNRVLWSCDEEAVRQQSEAAFRAAVKRYKANWQSRQNSAAEPYSGCGI